jgi:Raf kinase inhibitor-like YbhB/YbcL family protein
MHSRRSLLGGVGAIVAGTLTGCNSVTEGGSGASDSAVTTLSTTSSMTISTPAFEDGGTIPQRYTADGEDVSPPLSIDGVPSAAGSLALVVDDPDAPGGTFVHWLLWNLPTGTTEIPENQPQARKLAALGDAKQGTNGFGELGYRGPRPPAEDGPHTYRFTLYAIRKPVNVQAGARKGRLDEAMAGNTIASARIAGEYESE